MLRRKLRTEARPAEPITVHVTDEQDSFPIVPDQWRDLVGGVLAAEGVTGPGELNVLFVERDEIALLNKLHMGVSGATDVLSFPIDSDDDLDDAEIRMVGDVVVCPSVAAENAATHAGSYPDELALLLVHGTLHLLGHDHGVDADRRRMWDRERELVGELYGRLRLDPWVDR
jgi:probable rRNA maturation factor